LALSSEEEGASRAAFQLQGSAMAAPMEVEDALEAQRKAHPDLLEHLDTIHKYATTKLFHQLTQALLEYLGQPCFAEQKAADELLAFFNGYIKPFEAKFNKIHSLRLLGIVCGPQTPAVALELLAPFEANCEGDRDAKFVWQTLKAEKLTLAGNFDEAKDSLEELDKAITDAYEVDAFIQSQFHKTYAVLWNKLGRPQEYFKSSIMYLAFTPLSAIPEKERPKLAFDVGVAALIAPEEFIFGELLQQELLGTPLTASAEYGWIKDILQAFGEGKFDMYDKALAQHKAKLDATPALKDKEATVLRPKMAALAMVELAFRKPKKSRRLTFEELALHCRVGAKEVEHLVMKAMCAQLIKGRIDEVAQVVIVTWVKPRILDNARIDLMRERMDQWSQQTGMIVDHLEEMTPELLVS
jgi:26S proteasome regulatory subunit N9